MSAQLQERAPYDFNRATFPAVETSNATMMDGKKEQVHCYQVVAVHKGEFKNPVTVRVWMGRSSTASVVYASIWVSTKDGRWFGGRGQAGGYGYHKMSAAINEAVRSAGIKMAANFDGCGAQPTRVALDAITRAAGYRKFTIIES